MTTKVLNDRLSLVLQGIMVGIYVTLFIIYNLNSNGGVLVGVTLLVMSAYGYTMQSDLYKGEERRNLARFAGFSLIAISTIVVFVCIHTGQKGYFLYGTIVGLYGLGTYLAFDWHLILRWIKNIKSIKESR